MSSTLQNAALGAAVKVIPGAGAAVAVVKNIPVVGGALSSALQKSDPQHDATRKNEIDTAFNAAIGGSIVEAVHVRQRTGSFGTVQLPGYGPMGGSGSDVGKSYAKQRWQQLVAAKPGIDAQVAAYVSGGGSPAANVVAHAMQHTTFGLPTWALVLVVGLIAVAFVLWRRR